MESVPSCCSWVCAFTEAVLYAHQQAARCKPAMVGVHRLHKLQFSPVPCCSKISALGVSLRLALSPLLLLFCFKLLFAVCLSLFCLCVADSPVLKRLSVSRTHMHNLGIFLTEFPQEHEESLLALTLISHSYPLATPLH